MAYLPQPLVDLIDLFFGSSNNLLVTLILLVTLDYVTGICLSVRRHKTSSAIGAAGIAKKICMFALISLCHLCDQYLLGQGDVIRSLATTSYIANEALSIIENCGKSGLEIPGKLKELIAYFKKPRSGDKK